MESSGGLNVFGKPKSCGPARGTPVTEETYAAYLANRDVCGPQGVGPMQLTFPGFQAAADAAGGCWRPEISVRYGLTVFAEWLRNSTDLDAFSRWNVGKPGPSPYATKALDLLPGWRKLIDS